MKVHYILLAALTFLGSHTSYATGATDCPDSQREKAAQTEPPPNEKKPPAKPVEGCPQCKKPISAAQPVHVNLTCPSSPIVMSTPLLVPVVDPAPHTDVDVDGNTDDPTPKGSNAPSDAKKKNAAIDAANWLKIAAIGIELVIVIALLGSGLWLLNARTLEKATDGLMFRRYWGGFGGEGSGWQLSAPLGRCLAGLLLISLGAALTAQAISVMKGNDALQLQGTNDQQEEAQEAPQSSEPLAPAVAATTASTSTGG